jgi:hypothetical protein
MVYLEKPAHQDLFPSSKYGQILACAVKATALFPPTELEPGTVIMLFGETFGCPVTLVVFQSGEVFQSGFHVGIVAELSGSVRLADALNSA